MGVIWDEKKDLRPGGTSIFEAYLGCLNETIHVCRCFYRQQSSRKSMRIRKRLGLEYVSRRLSHFEAAMAVC